MQHNQLVLTGIRKALTYVAAACMVLNVGTAYTHMVGSGHLDGITTYLLPILLFLICLSERIYTLDKVRKSITIIAILLAYLLLFALFSGSNLISTILEMAIVFALVFYYVLNEEENRLYLLIAYRDIIFIVALVSLFFWIFGSQLGIISPTGTITHVRGGKYEVMKSYFNLYIENEKTYIFGRFITSNRSIFVERGFAAFAFSIGWLYELFIEGKKSKTRMVVFFVVMISTLSMTGLIVVILTMMLYYIFNGTNKRILDFIRIVFIPVAVLMAYVGVRYLLDTKLSMGHSASSRMSDLVNGINAWKNSPIWGYGFGNASIIHDAYKTGYSNSITMVLSQGGLMIGSIYLWSFGRGLHHAIIAHNTNALIFITVSFVMFTFTAIGFTNMMIYLIIIFFESKTLLLKDTLDEDSL